jgi:hypothetical protein
MRWTFVAEDSTSAPQTDTSIAWPNDPTLNFDSGGRPLLPIDLMVNWCYALGLTVNRMRFQLPHLLPYGRPAIRPIEAAASPSSRPQLSENWRNPFYIKANEPVVVQRTNTTGVAEVDICAVDVTDGNKNTPQGDLYTLRFTKTITPTALTWTASGSIIFDDNLTPGRYSVLGADMGFGSGGIWRFIFPGPPLIGPSMGPVRAGGIGNQNLTSQGTRYQRWGYWGELGQFESLAPPQIDFFWISATAFSEGYVDVTPVRFGVRV